MTDRGRLRAPLLHRLDLLGLQADHIGNFVSGHPPGFHPPDQFPALFLPSLFESLLYPLFLALTPGIDNLRPPVPLRFDTVLVLLPEFLIRDKLPTQLFCILDVRVFFQNLQQNGIFHGIHLSPLMHIV